MSESIARMMQSRPGGGSSTLPVEYVAKAYNDNGYYICEKRIAARTLDDAWRRAGRWTRGWARTVRVFANGVEQSR